MKLFCLMWLGLILVVYLRFDGLVFLRADEATVEEHKAHMAQEAGGMPSSRNVQPWSWRAVLSANQMIRIRKVFDASLVSSDGVFLYLWGETVGICHPFCPGAFRF